MERIKATGEGWDWGEKKQADDAQETSLLVPDVCISCTAWPQLVYWEGVSHENSTS